MSIEKETQAIWFQLNEYEHTARARADERAAQDFPDRPWTDEDHESTRLMVQEMTGRLARVEDRLGVLYQIGHASLKAINQLTFSVITAVIAYLIVSVWHA